MVGACRHEEVRLIDLHVSPQAIITAASCIAALIALAGYVFKARDWVKEQDKQASAVTELKTRHDADVCEIKEEQTLLVYGILACLKGLKEQGCDGPVTEAVEKIDKYLNKKAHDQI